MTLAISLSVVVPIYGCVGTIDELCQRVVALENNEMAIEVILVDDASRDGGTEILSTINARYPQCRAILLPRNFGQHWATSRGILESSGDRVVIMDCDLENKPEDILKLVSELSVRDVCVLGSTSDRGKRTFVRQIFRRLYGKMLSRCYRNDLIELGFNSFSFAAFDGQFIRQMVQNQSPYDPISIKILDSGVSIKVVPVENSHSENRRSTYSFFENLLLAFKSLVLAGKGFQSLCVQGLIWISAALVALIITLVYLLHTNTSTFFSLIVGLAALGLFTLGAGLVLVLLTSIIIGSINQTQSALMIPAAPEPKDD
jgi:dolichol-phosphate mannosyltransferase